MFLEFMLPTVDTGKKSKGKGIKRKNQRYESRIIETEITGLQITNETTNWSICRVRNSIRNYLVRMCNSVIRELRANEIAVGRCFQLWTMSPQYSRKRSLKWCRNVKSVIKIKIPVVIGTDRSFNFQVEFVNRFRILIIRCSINASGNNKV